MKIKFSINETIIKKNAAAKRKNKIERKAAIYCHYRSQIKCVEIQQNRTQQITSE